MLLCLRLLTECNNARESMVPCISSASGRPCAPSVKTVLSDSYVVAAGGGSSYEQIVRRKRRCIESDLLAL